MTQRAERVAGESSSEEGRAASGLHIRLPLQVGSTAHWSFTRAPIPIAVAALVGIYAYRRGAESGLASQEDIVGVLLLSLLALICLAYSVFHLRGAAVRRASDMVMSSSGVELPGYLGGATSIPWSSLSPPYASVEKGRQRQLSALGAILFILTVFRAAWPVREVTVWRLFVYPKGKKTLVAKSDREMEARSMEAAAESIVAVQEGRRRVAEAPAVSVETVECPGCGAPVVPAAAARVSCGHCGKEIELAEHVRKQASAAMAVQRSRQRVSAMTRELLEQPGAPSTNRLLLLLWLSMVAPWPATLFAYRAHHAAGTERMAWGLPLEALWLVPLAVMLAAWALGAMRLARRGGMQLLTLGFGALAPSKEGDAPLCRRCHGPLPDTGVDAVIQCAYCRSDNVTGIDARPFVDKARAEQRTLDEMLERQVKTRKAWTALAAAGLVLSAAALALLASAFRHLPAA